jgi:hypothetical protein
MAPFPPLVLLAATVEKTTGDGSSSAPCVIVVLLVLVALYWVNRNRKPSTQTSTGRADAKRPIPQALPAEVTAEWGFRYMHQQIAQTPEGQRNKLLEEATQVTDDYDTFINQCPALIGCVYDVSRLPHPKERIMVAICLVSCVADDSALRERLGFLLKSLAQFREGLGLQLSE